MCLWWQNHWYFYPITLAYVPCNAHSYFLPQAFFLEQMFPRFTFLVCYFVVFVWGSIAARWKSRTWLGLLISFTQPHCLWSASRSFPIFLLLSSLKFQLVSSHKKCSISNIMVNSESESLLYHQLIRISSKKCSAVASWYYFT